MNSLVSNGELTGSVLADNVRIVPETGKIYWLARKKRAVAGQEAGFVKRGGLGSGGGYRLLTVDQKKYRAHRLVWLWVHGAWPSGELDHINSDRDDNRISNLRQATVSQNKINRVIQGNNKSGFKWVYWCKQNKAWRAEIRTLSSSGQGRKYLHNSYHKTPEAAHEAACAAAKKIYGEWYNSGVIE